MVLAGGFFCCYIVEVYLHVVACLDFDLPDIERRIDVLRGKALDLLTGAAVSSSDFGLALELAPS